MSEQGPSLMGALRQGKADADAICGTVAMGAQGLGGFAQIIYGLLFFTSFGVDMLVRHSFGSRYMSPLTWILGVIGYTVFAMILVPMDESRAIEIVGSMLLLAGPTHFVHWFVRVRRFRLHSGFPGVSWLPWDRLVFWRVGYWQPLCVFDPMLACGVGWLITAMGYTLGWYFIVSGIVSSLRHTYYFLVAHSCQVDRRDAMIETGLQMEESLWHEPVLEPSAVKASGAAWH